MPPHPAVAGVPVELYEGRAAAFGRAVKSVLRRTPGQLIRQAQVPEAKRLLATFQLRRFGSGCDPGQVDRLFDNVLGAPDGP